MKNPLSGIGGRLTANWKNLSLKHDPLQYLLKIVAAANAGESKQVGELMQARDAGRLMAANSFWLDKIIQTSTPEGFAVLMAQPKISLDDKRIYLNEAIHYNLPAHAEVLLKDKTVATQAQKDMLLSREFVLYDAAEERVRLGQLLIKYGADGNAALEQDKKTREQDRTEALSMLEASDKRHAAFAAKLQPAPG